ncbi:BRICHOS domain protein [Onchocerca flexuosa]|uniref:BRICHOS domain protein n=2 Tax=Onchocerca flexuosa TaxID=387005 RepID=A0A238BUW0_9BILA|nr:BRICHOS domain protein [Onchocerca flexuosa]
MSYESPTKKIEQEEISRHYVSESRRLPRIAGSRGPLQEILTETIERRYNEELPIHDFCRISQSSLQPTSSTFNNEAERRYYATGERDCSRDASFLQTSGMSSGSRPESINISYLKSSSNLDQSTTNIHSYGYDVHEVHTSEGGARIVQTHGTGLIQGDRSAIEQSERSLNQQRIHSDRSVEHQRTVLIQERSEGKSSRISSSLKSGHKEVGFLDSARTAANEISTAIDHHRKTIYTLPLPSTDRTESWQRVGTLPTESTLSRKDSYKRMQMEQQDDSADVYAPRSDASLIAGFTRSPSQSSEEMLTPWEQMVQFMRKIISRARNTTWTPRLICLLLLFLLLVTLFFVLLGIIFRALFGSYSARTLSLYPPICEKCHNSVYNQFPSRLHILFYSSSQVHFELTGNLPLRSNSFSVIDFETGYVAVADHALIDASGRHIACFLIPLDRSAIPSISALHDALSSVSSEIHSEYGWQEYWQYHAEAIDAKNAEHKFTNKIDQCRGAKWYLLKHTVYTRDSSCSNCYDFCLPNYAIQRLHKYEDDMSIGIRRLDCFRLYVPEWEKYQLIPDNQGGHWSYPVIPSNV